MSEENVKKILSKLNELHKLIDDHSKGKNIGKIEKQHQSKKVNKKVEYSDFSSILSGNDDDTLDSHKQKNKKQAKTHSEQPKSQPKSSPKSVKKSTKTKKLTNRKNIKSKTPKKSTRKIKEFKEEEEIENEIFDNDLSIHIDNLHKISTECKALDSRIEASLSPKSVKTQPSNKSGSSINSRNSNTKVKTSTSPSKASQNSQKQHISSTPSYISSNVQKIDFEEEEEELDSSHNSNNAPSFDNIVTNSTSSQVYVIEQGTQTHLSSSQHANSYESSKNYSNTQPLLDINDNSNREIDLIEEEEDILSEEETNSHNSSQAEKKNQASVTNKKKEELNIQSRKAKNSSESDTKNQPKPHEEEIVFENVQSRSIELNDNDDNSIEESNLSSEYLRNLNNQSSGNSSSDISIEAINSSSDENEGQIIQSPVKTKTVKPTEFLEPIIDQTDSESEKKKQKQAPPQIKIPENQKIIQKKNKTSNYDDIIDIDMDLENRSDIIEILQTSSSDEENSQPPNIIFSSSTTPKSAKTPEFIKPVFSSESESKHTTDTDKEKEGKLSPTEEQISNYDKSVPIYLNEDEVEIVTNKELDSLKNQVIGNDLLLNISSSEPLSFEEDDKDDKDLILLHTTDSSGENAF